ncbi:MAG TPA: hypothetical protein VFR37_18600 [Longimicrobium sp.]|nr:hypothetical protein [Longimicrobium sp.]
MIRPIRIPLVAAALAILAGCGGASRAEPARADTAASEPAPAAAWDTLVRPAAPRYAYTLLDSATAEVDGDGAAERIDLAATVEMGDDGRPLWEDGHHWMVAVRDGADTYPLAQHFVPWGGAAFWVVAEGSAGPAAILVQTSTRIGEDGGTRLEKFVFDRGRGGYVRTGLVEAFGAAQYRGPPESAVLLPPTTRGP